MEEDNAKKAPSSYQLYKYFVWSFGFLRHEGKNAVLLLLIRSLAAVKEDPGGDFDQYTWTGWICG